jgi:hypothetical protein
VAPLHRTSVDFRSSPNTRCCWRVGPRRVDLSSQTPLLGRHGAPVLRQVRTLGQYRKQTLIERYGADMRLPDSREEIAQCSRQSKMHDGCMVRFVDLVPSVR